ncbi:MAG: hypothetical protein J5640_05875 [Bacteroidales bacterium]|nr:hypothetical protein [Bacteroidales bacterium]
MKKYLFIILAGLLALASCNKEIQTEVVDPQDKPETQTDLIPMTFKASVEDLATKADIQNDFIVWESSDKIAIFDGTTSFKEFTVSALSPSGKGAEFSGSAAFAASYVAVAPYSAASTIKTENERFSITVHGTQTIIGAHSVDPESLVSTAVAAGTTNLDFTNQFALLKVKLEKSNIMEVTVKGNNNEIISGTNHFYYGGEGAPRVDLTNAGGKQVKLVYKATASSANSAFPAGEYYIAIWPTEFSGGYSIILTDEDGSKSIKTNSNAQSLARNGGQDLSTVDDFSFCPPVITTAAQLKTWRRLASHGAYAEGDEVKLGADINLEGYSWTPVDQFLGVFDGQNHKIYNFTISSDAAKVGFIGILGSSNAEVAQLKNVVFGSSNGTSYDGTSSIEITGARSDWTYGGIVGYAHKKTTISGLTNYMPVSAAASVTGKHAIGGISGSGNGGEGKGITITGCHNYGSVTDRSSCETKNNSAIGGILGATDGSYTNVSNCENHAEIHNYCVGVSRLGGIVGKAWDANATIDGCLNEGNIVNDAASVSEGTGDWDKVVSVGGILGAFTHKDGGLLVNKCTNRGRIYNNAETSTNYNHAFGGIVGSVPRGDENNNISGAIKGCANYGKIYDNADFKSRIAMGGILGSCNSNSFLITKAEDDTPNTNNGEIFHYKKHNDKPTWVGGIVGLENKVETIVEYSVNYGRLVSDPSGQTAQTYHTGGICGASSGKIRHCTNNGYIFVYAGNLTAWVGGICGGDDSPQEVSDCTNNGYLSPFNSKQSDGSSECGGILAFLNPNTTTVSNCTNAGMVTTGDFYRNGSGNNPGTLRSFYDRSYYMGGLFGHVDAPTADVTVAEGCIVACTFGQRTGSEAKDNYKGIITGRTMSKSSTGYKVTFGSAASPVMIVNTTNFQYGTNDNPAVITQGDVVNTTAIAYKWLMGSSSSLYDATNGTSDASKVDFNFVLATPAQAGVE